MPGKSLGPSCVTSSFRATMKGATLCSHVGDHCWAKLCEVSFMLIRGMRHARTQKAYTHSSTTRTTLFYNRCSTTAQGSFLQEGALIIIDVEFWAEVAASCQEDRLAPVRMKTLDQIRRCDMRTRAVSWECFIGVLTILSVSPPKHCCSK